MNLKQKIIGAIVAIGLVLIGIFMHGLYSNNSVNSGSVKSTAVLESSQPPPTSIPYVVSTSPQGLRDQNVVVPSDQKIEITFSEPIENKGEVKNTLDPQTDYSIDLSGDKKTVILTSNKPFELGRSFTFTIKQDTKFVGGKRLQHDEYFHFSTVAYQGV